MNCRNKAEILISERRRQLSSLEGVLAEKKGHKTKTGRSFFTVVYLVCFIVCAILTVNYLNMMFHSKSDNPLLITEAGRGVIMILAGSSGILLFGLFLLKNLLNWKFYNVIFDSEKKVEELERILETSRNWGDLLSGEFAGDNSYDANIEMNDDFDMAINEVKNKLSSLEKGKQKVISCSTRLVFLLVMFSTGAMLGLFLWLYGWKEVLFEEFLSEVILIIGILVFLFLILSEYMNLYSGIKNIFWVSKRKYYFIGGIIMFLIGYYCGFTIYMKLCGV